MHPRLSRRGRGPAGPAVRRSSSRPWCGGLLSTSTSPVYRSHLQRTPLIIAKVSARYDSLSLLMIDRPASQHHGTPLTADRPECIANRPRLYVTESMLRVWTRLSACRGTESHCCKLGAWWPCWQRNPIGPMAPPGPRRINRPTSSRCLSPGSARKMVLAGSVTARAIGSYVGRSSSSAC